MGSTDHDHSPHPHPGPPRPSPLKGKERVFARVTPFVTPTRALEKVRLVRHRARVRPLARPSSRKQLLARGRLVLAVLDEARNDRIDLRSIFHRRHVSPRDLCS